MNDITNSNGGGGNRRNQQQLTIINRFDSIFTAIMDFCCDNMDDSHDESTLLLLTTPTSLIFWVFWSIVVSIIGVAVNIAVKIRRCQNDIFEIDVSNDDDLLNKADDKGDGSNKTNDQCEPRNVVNEKSFHSQHFSQQQQHKDPVKYDQQQQSNQIISKPIEDRQQWMNEVIKWFRMKSINDQPFIQSIIDEWLNSLNNQSQKLINENRLYVEFIRIEQLNGEQLQQMKMIEELNENLITTMKATCDQLIIQVRVAPDMNCDPNLAAIYHVIMNRFSSLLKIVGITDELLFVIRPLERPETRAQIEGPLIGSKNRFQHDSIIDAVMNIFTSTIFDLNFNDISMIDRSFPQLAVKESSSSTTKSNKTMNQMFNDINKSNIERKLLIKISKANDLNLNDSNNNDIGIYCQIELDEPFQTARTTIIREKMAADNCLEWDQHFMFTLNENSYELLFELFDENRQKSKSNDENRIRADQILGNAIVNIRELLSNPSQSQILTLQSGTNNKENIGNLIVEFLLMEHTRNGSIRRHQHQQQQQQQNQFKRTQSMTKQDKLVNNNTNNIAYHDELAEKNRRHSSSVNVRRHRGRSSLSSSSVLTTSTTFNDYCDQNYRHLVDLSNEFECYQPMNDDHHNQQSAVHSNTIKHRDTLLDNQSKRSSSSFLNTLENDMSMNFENELISDFNNNNIDIDLPMKQEPKTSRHLNSIKYLDNTKSSTQEDPGYNSGDNVQSIQSLDESHQKSTSNNDALRQQPMKYATLDKRDSGPRSRDKSLLRNIKKRFSFNRRSKSMDRNLGKRSTAVSDDEDDDDYFERNGMERARSVPGEKREPSMPKEIQQQQQSGSMIKESFGNLSKASIRTFMHEDSTIIVECQEKGITKHYVMPNDDFDKIKHELKRRKGQKLHLYKDHLFIAKHAASSKLCQICGKKFPFRLGKQAYQCRDCGLISHKPCHIKVETRCFATSVGALNLEFTDDNALSNDLQQLNNINNNTAIVPELKITDTDNDNHIDNIIDNNNIDYRQ